MDRSRSGAAPHGRTRLASRTCASPRRRGCFRRPAGAVSLLAALAACAPRAEPCPRAPAPASATPDSADRDLDRADRAGRARPRLQGRHHDARGGPRPGARASSGRASSARAAAAENEFVAAELRAAPGSFGYCGVSPLEPWALAELQRCATELGLRGVKLHVTPARCLVRGCMSWHARGMSWRARRGPEHVGRVGAWAGFGAAGGARRAARRFRWRQRRPRLSSLPRQVPP